MQQTIAVVKGLTLNLDGNSTHWGLNLLKTLSMISVFIERILILKELSHYLCKCSKNWETSSNTNGPLAVIPIRFQAIYLILKCCKCQEV